MILIGYTLSVITFCNILWCFIPFRIHSLRIHFRHSFLLLLIYIFLYHLSLSCYGTNSSEIKATYPRYKKSIVPQHEFPELYGLLNLTSKYKYHNLRPEPTTLNLSLFHSCSRLFVHNLVFNFWIDYMSVKINIL